MPGPTGLFRRRRFPRLLTGAVFSLCFCGTASADVIRLLDGTRYEGEIKREPDGYMVTLADGKRFLIPVDKVAALEAKPKNGDGIPEQRLASLRRAVENVPDIKQIIERFKAFSQQYAGTPAGEQAKIDLATWQDRLDRKMIKVGDKWVTEAERKALAEKSFQTAEQAMKLLERGRTNEATPLVDQALNESQQNPAAWFLRGLVLWKQDKAPEAHKAFDQVIALAPDNAAAHNDLAVVLWRQNQHVAALMSYDRALLASPLNRQILDNLAEAFNALEPELRDRTTVKKIVRHFNDQEVLVQQQFVSQGLYRWGSSWVTKTDFDKLKAQEKEIRDRVDRMEADYNAVTARIKQLNEDIASVEKTLRRMEADSYAVDANGRTIRFPLPPSYYTFVRDLGSMKADREQRAAEQDLMRKQAKQLVQSIPTPRYTGVQRMIEWEGTPVIGKPAAVPPAGPPGAPVVAAPVVPGPVAPVPAAPVAPATPPTAVVPPATPAPSAPPAEWPRPPSIPPEKPTILDRRLYDLPPRTDRPLLDDKPPG